MEWRKEQKKSASKMGDFGRKIIENCGKPLLLVLTCSKTCTICMQDVFIFNMFKIHGCSHRYCYSCMKRYIEFKVRNESNVPRCPHDSCHTKLNKIKRYKRFLSFKARNLLEDRLMEDFVQDRFYCPYSNCSALLMRLPQHEAGKCSKCGRVVCIKCRVPWHYGISCDIYKQRFPGTENDVKFKVLALNESWRQCPYCKHMIELGGGCSYIYCRCGRQFCYICGAATSGDHKCSCYKR